MKNYQRLSRLFIMLAILLSNVMCAAVAYSYCDMKWAVQYCLTSAPAWVSFLLIIPYAVGIAICAVLAWFFHKKQEIRDSTRTFK